MIPLALSRGDFAEYVSALERQCAAVPKRLPDPSDRPNIIPNKAS
jgi:hypothetical protein